MFQLRACVLCVLRTVRITSTFLMYTFCTETCMCTHVSSTRMFQDAEGTPHEDEGDSGATDDNNAEGICKYIPCKEVVGRGR